MTEKYLQLAWFAVLLCLGGCSGSSQLGDVEGTVTLQGQPLANVRVEYFPDRKHQSHGIRSCAMTDEKGHYVLQCDDGRAGAAVGAHLVVITFDESWQSRDDDPRNPGTARRRPPPKSQTNPAIPARYTAAVTTPLKPEVKPGLQTIDLTLVAESAGASSQRDE